MPMRTNRWRRRCWMGRRDERHPASKAAPRMSLSLMRATVSPGWRPARCVIPCAACRAHAGAARSGRLRLVYGLDAIKNLAEIALRDLNVIVVLQIEPKLCRCAERLGEPKRGIRRDAGLFAGDPFDSCPRQAADLGKRARRHLERNEELLPQNLTGMHGLELLGHWGFLS